MPAIANSTAAMISFFFILILISRYSKTNVISWRALAAAHAGSYILQPTDFKRRTFNNVFALPAWAHVVCVGA